MRYLDSWTRPLALLLMGVAAPSPAIGPPGPPLAGQPFLAADGQLRAEVPRRGLSARFDSGGAHLVVALADEPISVRTNGVGRGVIRPVPATAPVLGERGLEYVSAGVTEWWGAGPGGFEQGWVVPGRPRGAGPLRIRVAVENATITVDHAGVALRGRRGDTLAVGGLYAVDASGEPVPVRFEGAPDGFDVVVDDEGAAYPVLVDPVYTTPDWTVEGTPGFGDADLARVMPAGDTNGDGYDDVIVQDDDGAAYLYQGGPSGMEALPASILDCVGPADGAGDIDGDGFDDVVFGSDVGEVSVYSGGPSGLSEAATSVVTEHHPSGTGGFGEAVSGAGDVNGDGFDDVIVAAPRYSNVGRVYLYLGSASGLEASPLTTLQGARGDELGAVVSAPRDVDGDGSGEVAVSSPNYSDSAVYVYLGSADGLDATPIYSNFGGILDVGSALAAAGDVDGDGYDDVLIGTALCWEDCHSGYYGTVTVVPGSSSGPEGVGWSISGDSTATQVGLYVAGAGDVDQDGYDDVQVGASLYRGTAAGVEFSSPRRVTLDADLTAVAGVGDANGDGFPDVVATTARTAQLFLGSGAADLSESHAIGGEADFLGAALVAAGDLDGDGYDDVVVGAHGHDGNSGEVLVYLGSEIGLGAVANSTILGAAGEHLGFALAAAGDVNGDGYDDVVIGAYGSGEGGAAYVYSGSAAGVAATPTTLLGDASTSNLGFRVASVGDVNGDGYSDVAVGTVNGDDLLRIYAGAGSGVSTEPSVELLSLPGPPTCVAAVGDVDRDGFSDFAVGLANDDDGPGEVQVFLGSAVGPPSSPSVSLLGERDGDHFGGSVAAAGDVDGDGYDDLVIGASGSERDTGRVYLYAGGPDGLGATPATTISGDARGDELGSWVAPAGDLDGDGFDDVVVAAPGLDAVLVYGGSAAGLGETPSSSASGFVSLNDPVAVADVNGDGLLDVLATDFEQLGSGGRVNAWYGCVDADVDGACWGPDCDDADPTIGALYADADGDGFGDPSARLAVCQPGAGYVSDATDCDDTDADVSPAAEEVCDGSGLDEDCDGWSNGTDAVDGSVWYADGDMDGYTNFDAKITSCLRLPYYAERSLEPDCDDANWTVHPGRREVCDGIDNDCDEQIDVSAVDGEVWYADQDHDGYGDPAEGEVVCEPPEGWVQSGRLFDCDDSDPNVRPSAYDPPGDGVDQDCDGDSGACGGCNTHASPPLAGVVLLATIAVRRRRRA